MARQRYYHDPARKHIEAYQDFSGGLNTTSSNENTRDNELKKLVNMDLSERGSLKRRKGFVSTPIEGTGADDYGDAQGFWRYHRRYIPYNLIGIEGSFDGPIHTVRGKERIGAWIHYNLHESEHTYKIEREEAANITVNPQFENGEEGWRLNIPAEKGRARIWSNTDTAGADRVLYIEQYQGVKGYLGEYQVPIVPTMEGEEFYAEVMVRRPNFQHNGPNGPLPSRPDKAHLGAYIFKDDGTSEYMFIHSDFNITASWQKISGYFKMPKGATGVRLGLGISDYTTAHTGCYFDLFHARRKASDVDNGAMAITSENIPDWNKWGGVGYNFAIEPNKYYLLLVDYKSDPQALGAMEVFDRRFGLPARTRKTYGASTEWGVQYMKFRTSEGMREARLNLYNRTLPTVAGTVFYDSARIYEVTTDVYEKIDNDPDYTGESLTARYPFRSGVLKSETISESVVAKGGKFYVNGVEKKVDGGRPIQTDRIIEAAMYYDNLYIASGSGLLVYNGSSIAPVESYNPDPLETLYIGSNALEETPFEVHDETSEVIGVYQIKFSKKYGVTNEFLTVSVGVYKPAGTKVEYKFERKRSTDKESYWFVGQDWSEDNEYTFSTDIAGDYQFKVSVREKGKTAKADEYIIPKYIIKPTSEDDDIPIDGNTIDLCNRILIHWDRLILYGDDSKADVMYISHLRNPNYFPVNNTLQFHNPRKERITSITPYRDNLVIFTPTSIQALFGKSPEDFQRIILNTDLGNIADRSVQVVKNQIMFLSYEGIATLKSVGTSESRANVDIIDEKVRNLVEIREDPCSTVVNNQYHLVFPNRNSRLRYYYETNTWAYDESPSFDFMDMTYENTLLYAVGKDGRIITSADVYTDEGYVYEDIVETKFYTFGEPYAIKKTRELQLMTNKNLEPTTVNVAVQLDQTIVKEEAIEIKPSEEIYMVRMAGKGLNVKMITSHRDATDNHIVGLGMIFKLKNP